MAQQMVNGSYYDGDVTVTNRMTDRYAVVGEAFRGAHMKPQTPAAIRRRKSRNEHSLENTKKPPTIWRGVLVKRMGV